METFISAYLINTAASSFDLATTALLHAKTGNPNEHNRHIRREMNRLGPLRAAIRGETARRIGYAVIGLTSLGVEKVYEIATNMEAFPVHSALLLVPAALYGLSGLANLIPLAFNTRDHDVF